MSIKSILFTYGGHGREAGVLDAALSMAYAYRATLRIVHVAPPPILPYVMGIPDLAYAVAGDQTLLDTLEADAHELADNAWKTASAACQKQVVPLRKGLSDMVPGQAQATYRTIVGEIGACLPREALTADLVISAHENHPAADLNEPLATLFEAGRPILLLPRDASTPFPASGHANIVVLAWDGSRAAAKALRESVSHMMYCKDVFLLRITSPHDPTDTVAEEDVLSYLRSHGITGQFVHVDKDRRGIGEAIIEEAAALRADMLIMGAYGHGHVREMLFGGATDHVVKTAALPLLLVR